MNTEFIREYCLSKKEVTESLPFGPSVLVFKVCGKIFLMMSLDSMPLQFNAKCIPDLAIELREKYSAIIPGFHMNKTHWNTIIVDGTLSDIFVLQQIDNSYNLIVESLPNKVRANIVF